MMERANEIVVFTVPTFLEENAAYIIEQVLGITPIIETYPDSQEVRLIVYLPQNLSETSIEHSIKWIVNLIELGEYKGLVRLERKRLVSNDWTEVWKLHFNPILVANLLWIRASFHTQPPPPYTLEIIIDPGLSFGTGHHPTTLYCLEKLVAINLGYPTLRTSMLDIGTGSGILAIAAAKLGFKYVVGIDIDTQAVYSAVNNLCRNGIKKEAVIIQADIEELVCELFPPFSVICANLTADLIIKCAIKLNKLLLPNGFLAVAGILSYQFDKVSQALKEVNMELVEQKSTHEWTGGLFRKPPDHILPPGK